MNVNPSKFTPKELASIYEQLILQWELDLSQGAHFDVRSKKYRKIKEEFRLTVDCIDSEAETQEQYRQYKALPDSSENHLSFHNQKQNLLLSLFCTLRNAAAHGDIRLVTIGSRRCFVFGHFNKQKIKLYGQVRVADFWKLHKVLVSLKSIRKKS